MKTKSSNRLLLSASIFSTAMITGSLDAAALYKVNNSENLNSTASWTDTSGLLNPPASIGTTDSLYFNQVNMQGNKTVLLGGDLAVGGLALDWAGTTDPGTGNYSSLVINSGNTLTLNATSLGGTGVAGTNYPGAGIVLNRGTGGTLTIQSNVALGAAQQWVTGRFSGTPLTVTGDINLGANNLRLNMVNADSTNTLSGIISGTGKVTKENSGVLNISGNNTFSGGFQLGADAGAANSGVVNVGHANALGTNTVIIRGTQLRSSVADLVIPNNFSMGAGGFRLGGTNNFSISGTLAMDAASRTIANYGTATVTLGNISTVAGSTLALDNAAGAGSGAPIIVNGVISGPGAVALSGNQFTTFNGVNTYAGTTTMSGGRITGTGTIPTLLAMSGGSIAIPGGATTGGTLTLGAGATLTGTPTVLFNTAPLPATVYDVFNYTGTVTGLANLKPTYRGTFTDTGTKVTFTLGAQNQQRTWNTTTGTWDGAGTNAVWLEDDNKFFSGDAAIFPEPTAVSTVTLSGTITATGFSVGNTTNAYTFTGGSLTGTAGLTKTGAGAMTIGNGHTYTGNVLVSGGTVTGTGGVPSANTNSSFGLKSSSRTVTAENTGTIWLTGTGGSSNTFGGAGMTASQIPTLIAKDGGTIRTGKFNTVGNIILQNGGRLTNSSTETSGSYAGYQFVGDITVSGAGTGAFMDLNGSTRPNHLRPGTPTTFDVADITTSSAADLTVSAPLTDGSGDYAGVGSIIKTNDGTMVLAATNPYTGSTTVNSGTLEVSGSIGAGAVSTANGSTLKFSGTGTLNSGSYAGTITNNGTLAFIGSAAQTLTGEVSGTGALTKSGSGTLTLGTINSYSGPTTISGGTLALSSSGQIDAASAVAVNGGGTLTGTGIVSGPVTVNTGGTITGNGATLSLQVGALTFESTGTLNIGALNNYSNFAAVESLGNLTLNGGPNSVTVNLPVAPVAAGTYHLISSANTLANASNFVLGTVPALGSRQSGQLVANPGYLDYVVTGLNPVWTGALSGEWSTATLASPKNWFTNVETDYIDGDAVTFDDTATAGTTAVTLDGTVTPASVLFNHDSLSYSVSGTGAIAGTGGLTKSGTGTLTLNTANSYSGGTIVNAGSLVLGHASALGSGAITLNSAILGLGNHTLSNAITSTGGTLAGTTFQVNGVISGTTLDINATGIVKFNAVNTYAGATNILSGGLDIIGSSQLNSGDYSGTISNPALLRFNTTANQILRGAVSGSGALVKNQGSTLELFAQNPYTGGTTINGGTVKLSGGGGAAGTIRGTVILANAGTSLWLNTGDATGYNGNATSLTSINLGEGTVLHNNMDARIAGGNQTLGNAVVNMTGASITGVTGSNLDFFAGSSALNTFAAATTSTISGTAIDLRQASGVTFTVEDGVAAVDLEVSSLITNRAPTATGPGTGVSYGNNPLIKAGDGLMKLSGASNYTGNTTINGGTLDITTGQIYTGGYQAAAVITINTGGVLKITNLAYNENPGSAASLGGLRDYGNARVINGGTFEVLGAAHSTGNNFNVGTNGGTFRYDPPVDTDTITFNGNGNSNIAVSGALILDAVGNIIINEVIEGTGAVTKTGTGTLTLGGTNTRSGATTVNAGTLAINGSALADAASLIIDGGSVNLTGTETVDTLYFGASLQYAGTWGGPGSGAQYTDSRFTGTGFLSVTNGAAPPAGYDSWATQIPNAADRDRADDPDSDGFTNLQEFLFGTSPIANNGSLVTTTTSGGNLVITWLQRENGATYVLKESENMATGTWAPSDVTPAADPDQGGVPTDYDRFRAVIPITNNRSFFRVEGTEN